MDLETSANREKQPRREGGDYVPARCIGKQLKTYLIMTNLKWN